jgi:hypothetical protein
MKIRQLTAILLIAVFVVTFASCGADNTAVFPGGTSVVTERPSATPTPTATPAATTAAAATASVLTPSPTATANPTPTPTSTSEPDGGGEVIAISPDKANMFAAYVEILEREESEMTLPSDLSALEYPDLAKVLDIGNGKAEVIDITATAYPN